MSLRIFTRYYYLPLVFAAGLLWSTWYASHLLTWSLPKELEDKPIWVTGYIASLPVNNPFGTRFEFALDTINTKSKIRLLWHEHPQPLKVGEKYKLLVKLKRIHAPQNPGTFDFEAWALQKGIRATGYVLANSQSKLLSHDWYHYPIDQLRQQLQTKLQSHLPKSNTAPWLMALMIGERNGIAQEDWQILRNTGTNHLMAIGGLHIGILSGIIYYIVSWFWRTIPGLVLMLPAIQAGAYSALITALIYSSMAGFSIPTQRACLMLSVFIFALLSRKKIHAWHAWSLALCLVLMCNPLNILTESFCLSFGTIALIIYGMSGRLVPTGFWWKWGRVQWVIAIGLIPMTLVLFQECSFISFFANSIAIPWLEFFILPFCFLGCIFLFFSSSLAQILLFIADKSLAMLWTILTWFSHLHLLSFQLAMPNQIILIVTLFGLLLLLAPAGVPGKCLGFIWLMPLLCYKPIAPALGDFWITLMDVGQGLAIVVQTKKHTLIFDAGPRFSNQYNAGESIIIPYLHTMGTQQIDKLVISHGDNDHIGGAQAVLNAFPVIDIQTSVPEKFKNNNKSYCLDGQKWKWDQVNFAFIYPTMDTLHDGNNSSCVLRIDNGEQSILLTGDIEKKAEIKLLNHPDLKLKSNIIVVPHHGSKTSGLSAFIASISPQFALYAIGYRNRYHFPHKSVVNEYTKINTIQLNTVEHGAIRFEIKRNKDILPTELYRLSHKRYWMDG